jgi:precorrin-6B methylase 2
MQIAASLVRLSSWFEASTIGGSSNIPLICKAFNGALHAVVANFNQLELASTRRKAAAALIWSRKCQTYT